MSYFGNVVDRSSRVSIAFISLAGTRTPSAYSPASRFTVGCRPFHLIRRARCRTFFQPLSNTPVPLLLQRRPAPLDRIVLAVIRRIVHQADLQSRPVGELHHPLEELRPPARVLRPIVQLDH